MTIATYADPFSDSGKAPLSTRQEAGSRVP